MAENRWRGNKPKDRPDIKPVIYADRGAQSAIQRIHSPEDIDAFVKYLRVVFFKRWLGYEPPLVVDRPYISQHMREGQSRGLLTPDNYASMLWNQTFRNYVGTTGNLHALFVPFDSHLTGVRKEYVHRLSAVTFAVEGDMFTETGTLEGKARRKYSLTLNLLGSPNRLPQNLFQQAKRFYTHQELRDHRAVYMSTEVENSQEVKKIMAEAWDRVHRSRAVAEGAERRGITHPVQGGLPGLGKSS